MTAPGPLPIGAGGTTPPTPPRGPARGDNGSGPGAESRAGTGATRGTDGSARSADAGRAGARREPGTESPSERPFAELLVPATAPPLPAPATAVAEPAADGEAAASPGQLLALLDGQWSVPRTPAAQAGAPLVMPSPAGARQDASAANGSTPTAVLLAGTTATDAGAAQATATAASAGPSSTGAAAGGFALPAMAAAMAPAAAASGAADAPVATEPGSTIETPAPALLSATAPTAAARPQPTLAAAPLAMPAEPADGFDDGFGTRIAWMADQRIGHAEIRLNPEHVGRIDVRVQLDGSQVRAEFHSAHAEVRQAIEASLPRLRELLGQHGLQLGQADVGQRQAGQDDSTPRGTAARAGGDTVSGEDATPPAQVQARLRGLLDEYA
jgi:flagellar hook-length control protein FliK